MSKSKESLSFPPREINIEESVRRIREAKKSDPDAYALYTGEIYEYASGGRGVFGGREEYYPGWTDEDFRVLLKKLEQEGLVERVGDDIT